MQQININELKSHPRNNEFFDDMTGEKWKEFLESVKSRGVIEPIVITPDKVIVSGHQRVRACKELGIESVMCDVHTYNNDDEILQDLLETNIRQRGNIGGSAKKVGLRIKELERIYGIEHGNNQRTSNNYKSSKLQEELAKVANVNRETYRQAKRVLDSNNDDLKQRVLSGKTSISAGYKELTQGKNEEKANTNREENNTPCNV